MNIEEFENALHSDSVKNWFDNNVDNLIKGKPFQRENEITKIIVQNMGNPNVFTQNNYRDILNLNSGDIGEAAHNGTFQNATDGPEHIISDFYKRLGQDSKGNFYGLMYLMDIENLSNPTQFPYEKDLRANARPFLFQTKYLLEGLLNRLPGKVQIHEPFHNLKSTIETTILNYDIYVVKFPFNNSMAKAIYDEFNKEDFFKRVGFKQKFIL